MRNFSRLLLAAALACVAPIANAHPLPKTVSPKPNSALATSPMEVRIGFSEGLVAAFSGIEVDDRNGAPVATGAAIVNPNDSKELSVPIKAKLAPGVYTVKWHAVGDDTHHVSGQYSFQVQP